MKVRRYHAEDYYENKEKKHHVSKKMLFLIGFILLLGLFFISTIPKITLKNKDIKIEYGEKFNQKGKDYKASNWFSNLTSKVKISDNVNLNKVGKYQEKYQINYLFWKKTATRDIEVVDSVKPELTLPTKDDIVVCPKTNIENYQFDYKATDNYDGDVTDKVKVTEIKDQIQFSVSDSSSNETTIVKKLRREDKEKPILTLKGKETINLNVGDTYQESGYTVTDNCDGNLNKKVTVKNNVNMKKSGTYQIQYTVKDSSNNTTNVIRKVNVGVINNQSPKSDGVIYLTFDDGPSKTITPKLLDILKSENVKATFFVINHASSLDYLIKREYKEGHTVALHSYTHNYKTVYASDRAYFQDLEKIQAKVKNLIGINANIIRFPGGSSNTVSRHYSKGIMSRLVKEVENRGYRYFDWNVSSGDAGDVFTKEAVYRSVVNGLSHTKTNVVLMHDYENNYKTLNAIRDIIRYGKKQGYQFRAITSNTPQVKHNVNN